MTNKPTYVIKNNGYLLICKYLHKNILIGTRPVLLVCIKIIFSDHKLLCLKTNDPCRIGG